MAILIQVTEESGRQGVNETPISKLYGIPYFSSVSDNGTSATIIIDGRNSNEERVVSETYADIKTASEVGYLDFMLALNNVDGTDISLKASGIVEVYENSDSKGVIRYRDHERTEDIFYTVDEDMTAILALIPTAGGSLPYKSLVMLVSQTGGSAPTFTVLENTLGGGPSFLRLNTGWYALTTLSSVLTSGKTFLNIQQGLLDPINPYSSIAKWNSTNSIYVYSGDASFTLADGKLDNTSFEIRVYD